MRTIICLLIIIGLTSCAAKYQRIEGSCTPAWCPSGGGYQDFQINKNTWHLEVIGNGATSSTTVAQYFYRRAAEICQENNYGDYKIEHLNDSAAGYTGSATASGGMATAGVYRWPQMSGNVVCNKK